MALEKQNKSAIKAKSVHTKLYDIVQENDKSLQRTKNGINAYKSWCTEGVVYTINNLGMQLMDNITS